MRLVATRHECALAYLELRCLSIHKHTIAICDPLYYQYREDNKCQFLYSNPVGKTITMVQSKHFSHDNNIKNIDTGT